MVSAGRVNLLLFFFYFQGNAYVIVYRQDADATEYVSDGGGERGWCL